MICSGPLSAAGDGPDTGADAEFGLTGVSGRIPRETLREIDRTSVCSSSLGHNCGSIRPIVAGLRTSSAGASGTGNVGPAGFSGSGAGRTVFRSGSSGTGSKECPGSGGILSLGVIRPGSVGSKTDSTSGSARHSFRQSGCRVCTRQGVSGIVLDLTVSAEWR
jgi:hypothetical protein